MCWWETPLWENLPVGALHLRNLPEHYKPTVYENTGVDVFMDGIQISLGLWDTAGNDAFRSIRPCPTSRRTWC